MAHGIQEFDKGVLGLNSRSWHMHPQFIHQDTPVTREQVNTVFGFNIKKKPLHIITDAGLTVKVPGAHALVREDTGHVLVPSVGDRFVAESNLKLADIVYGGVLAAFPELTVEGCITLWNNQTAILQLKGQEFQVRGDQSPSFTRMSFNNPLGKGSYSAMVHNERVVCANTLRVALAEGAANKSLRRFSHTAKAFDKINSYMEEIAETKLALTRHVEELNQLSAVNATTEEVQDFLKFMFPIKEAMSDCQVERAKASKDKVLAVFESDQGMVAANRTSRYALLNALTFKVDHDDGNVGKRGRDLAANQWDNWCGTGMDKKIEAFNYLNRTVLTPMVAA
jgi:hypothetical protein